jgi:hypothetical protein
MQISLKELRESYYWMAVSIEGGIVTSDQSHALFDEARQLHAILSGDVATTKEDNKKS